MLEKQEKRIRRHRRVRAKVKGTAQVPRLCVFRSNQHIYAQLIDDEKGKTILSAKDFEVHPVKSVKGGAKQFDKVKKKKATKMELAKEVGKLIAQKALDKKIKKVIFDRAGYKYHGRVKSMAEGVREAGLKF